MSVVNIYKRVTSADICSHDVDGVIRQFDRGNRSTVIKDCGIDRSFVSVLEIKNNNAENGHRIRGVSVAFEIKRGAVGDYEQSSPVVSVVR